MIIFSDNWSVDDSRYLRYYHSNLGTVNSVHVLLILDNTLKYLKILLSLESNALAEFKYYAMRNIRLVEIRINRVIGIMLLTLLIHQSLLTFHITCPITPHSYDTVTLIWQYWHTFGFGDLVNSIVITFPLNILFQVLSRVQELLTFLMLGNYVAHVNIVQPSLL